MIGIQQFRNIHNNKFILVCGLGASLNLIQQEKLDNFNIITIGVNDIGRFLKTTYTLYQDNWDWTRKFSDINVADEKIWWIKNYISDYLFISNGARSQIINDINNPKNVIDFFPDFYDLGDKSEFSRLKNTNIQRQICTGNIFPTSWSVAGAISLAYYMGCRDIGLIGIDFSDFDAIDKFGVKSKIASRTISQLKQSIAFFKIFLEKLNCNFYNFSDRSSVFPFQTGIKTLEILAGINKI